MINKVINAGKSRMRYLALEWLTALSPIIPDRLYLKLRYLLHFGKKLNLTAPKGFTEKIQWMKVNKVLDAYSKYADKYEAKTIAGNLIGFEHIIPLLGVWERAEDVNFDSLPDKFVLKCNHNSGKGMIICRDKSKLDIAAARAELAAGLKEKFHLMAKEHQYREIKPLIIAETYMEEEGMDDLTDYKFHCFDGEIKMCEVITGRSTAKPAFNYYDINWNLLPIRSTRSANDPSAVIPKPAQYDEMLRIAKKLANGFPYVRIDLYLINGKIYFGEFTFTHAGGFGRFVPDEWENIIGGWIKLPSI